MPSRVLVSQIVPPNQVSALKCSQAANNFCIHLMKAAFEKNITLIPIFVDEKISANEFNFPIKVIQSRLSRKIIKIIRYLYVVLFDNLKLFWTISKLEEKNIWFYNLNIHNLGAFLLIQFLLKKKVFIVLADHSPPKRKISASNIIEKSLNLSSGIITLSNKTAKILTSSNISVIQGITATNKIKPAAKNEILKNKFLFSGALNKFTGIDLALDSFSKLPAIQLIITGEGDLKSKVLEYSKNYPNIKYLGLLSYPEFLNLLDEFDVVLSLRNPTIKDNLFNFPSKLLEFAANNKIIISTISYPDFDESTCFISKYCIGGLIQTINAIINTEDEILRAKMNALFKVTKNYQYQTWNKAIEEIESNAS